MILLIFWLDPVNADNCCNSFLMLKPGYLEVDRLAYWQVHTPPQSLEIYPLISVLDWFQDPSKVFFILFPLNLSGLFIFSWGEWIFKKRGGSHVLKSNHLNDNTKMESVFFFFLSGYSCYNKNLNSVCQFLFTHAGSHNAASLIFFIWFYICNMFETFM